MNRRTFFKSLAIAAAGFSILPSATSYDRKWAKANSDLWVPNPEYFNAPYEIAFISYEGSLSGLLIDRERDNSLKERPGFIRDEFPLRFRTKEIKDPIPVMIRQRA